MLLSVSLPEWTEQRDRVALIPLLFFGRETRLDCVAGYFAHC